MCLVTLWHVMGFLQPAFLISLQLVHWHVGDCRWLSGSLRFTNCNALPTVLRWWFSLRHILDPMFHPKFSFSRPVWYHRGMAALVSSEISGPSMIVPCLYAVVIIHLMFVGRVEWWFVFGFHDWRNIFSVVSGRSDLTPLRALCLMGLSAKKAHEGLDVSVLR